MHQIANWGRLLEQTCPAEQLRCPAGSSRECLPIIIQPAAKVRNVGPNGGHGSQEQPWQVSPETLGIIREMPRNRPWTVHLFSGNPQSPQNILQDICKLASCSAVGQRFLGRAALVVKGLLGGGEVHSKPPLPWAWQQLEGQKKKNRVVVFWSAKLKPTLDNVKASLKHTSH